MSIDELTKKRAILKILEEKKEISLIDLSKLMQKDKSNVAKVVKELELKGQIQTYKKKKKNSRYAQLFIKKGSGEKVSLTILDQRLGSLENDVDGLKAKLSLLISEVAPELKIKDSDEEK